MDKKEAIFKAALALLTEQGFYATPMSQLAKKANVAAGTIYHYFSSKEELIISLRSEINLEIGAVLKNNVDLNSDPKTRFYEYWINIFI